jgi:hypothetical protein
MSNRPYPMMRLAKLQSIDGQQTLLVELELANAPSISPQERISIHTLLPTPLPNPQHGLELAVLRRARDALDAQIAAVLQSP